MSRTMLRPQPPVQCVGVILMEITSLWFEPPDHRRHVAHSPSSGSPKPARVSLTPQTVYVAPATLMQRSQCNKYRLHIRRPCSQSEAAISAVGINAC